MSIAANAGLAMISPFNTAPGLTLRSYPKVNGWDFNQIHPPGKKVNYSDPPTDAVQGKVDADFTIDPLPAGLNAKSAYVVKDPLDDYSAIVASAYTGEFQTTDGTILGIATMPLENPSDLAGLSTRIVATRPAVVYYAGQIPDVAVLLKARLVEAGYRGPFVGNDGIALDPAFAAHAGEEAGGIYATLSAQDPAAFTAGAAEKFVLEYRGWYPNQNLDAYSANAYDAAMILITAMKNLIRAGAAVTREAVIDQVQRIQYAGVTGQITFDRNGDNPHAALSLYMVKNGKWVFAKPVRA